MLTKTAKEKNDVFAAIDACRYQPNKMVVLAKIAVGAHHEIVRQKAVRVMQMTDRAQMVRLLESYFDSEEVSTRIRAMKCMHLSGMMIPENLLLRGLTDPDTSVARMALIATGCPKNKLLEKKMIEFLEKNRSSFFVEVFLPKVFTVIRTMLSTVGARLNCKHSNQESLPKLPPQKSIH